MSRRLKTFIEGQVFGKYLLATNTLTFGLFMVVGDLIGQKMESAEELNLTRTVLKPLEMTNSRNASGTLSQQGKTEKYENFANMGIVGLAIGPLQHEIYRHLDRLYPLKTKEHIAKKILLDQCFNSSSSIVIIFAGINYLEGITWKETKRELKEKFWAVYLLDWIIWVPTQWLNFTYFPPKYRVLYINTMTIISNVLISMIKYAQMPKETDKRK